MTLTLPSQTMQETPPAGTRRRQVIASLLGAHSFEHIDWRRLMQDGVLVRLHVRRCRFTARLTLEDIGVHIEDAAVSEKLSKWLVLGEKRLLPADYMKMLSRIESGARAALKERAFRTELGAFVPSTAYGAWREATRSFQEEYFALRDRILANYRDLVRQVLAEYELIAQNTYQRLCATHPELVTESQRQFVTSYCNRIASQIPSPERIRESFDLTYILLDGPSQLGGSSEAMPAEVQESQEEGLARAEATRLAVEERERQRSLLQHDLRQHAQERLDLALDSFLSSVVGQLRNLIYDVACDVLSTLERRSGERFAPQSVRQLTNLLSRVRALNFSGDVEIEHMMDQVQEIVERSPAERQRSLADIERTMRAIATVTRYTLLELGEEPRLAPRELAIPVLPTEESFRQARAELGLEVDASQLANLALLPTSARAARAETVAQQVVSLWDSIESEPQRQSRFVSSGR